MPSACGYAKRDPPTGCSVRASGACVRVHASFQRSSYTRWNPPNPFSRHTPTCRIGNVLIPVRWRRPRRGRSGCDRGSRVSCSSPSTATNASLDTLISRKASLIAAPWRDPRAVEQDLAVRHGRSDFERRGRRHVPAARSRSPRSSLAAPARPQEPRERSSCSRRRCSPRRSRPAGSPPRARAVPEGCGRASPIPRRDGSQARWS